MELTAKAVGRLALASGTFTAEYVEDLVKRSFEWLQADRNESRRHAAVGIPVTFCSVVYNNFLYDHYFHPCTVFCELW